MRRVDDRPFYGPESARQRLTDLLERYDWEVRPSEASFIMARPKATIPDFAKHHILVRQFPEWPQLAGWVRFGFPGAESVWQRLEEALTLPGNKEPCHD